MSVPSAEEQVAFLARVQRLLDEGVFVSTYKLALLMALLDLAVERGEDSGEPMRIPLDAIAERVIGYYWRQVVPYAPAPGRGVPTVLAQSSGGPAAILAHVRQLREQCGGSLALARRDAPRWAATVREVRRVLRVMPLWKLQVVGGAPLEFLYPHRLAGEAIELLPGVAWNLRRFHGLVQGLVEAAWVRQVRRIRENQVLLGETVDLGEFLFGSERASLADYRPLLREVQAGACFYCRRPLHAAGEVDHFIPWSRYPVDLPHNFVLAHAQCNRDKRDFLGDLWHLEHWVERNAAQGEVLAQAFEGLRVVHDLTASRHVAHWSYAQAEQAGARVWLREHELRPLAPSWRALLPA